MAFAVLVTVINDPGFLIFSKFPLTDACHCPTPLYRALRRDSLCHLHLHSSLQNLASPRLARKRTPPLKNGDLQCSHILNVVPVAFMRAAVNSSAECKLSGRSASTGLLFLSGTKKIPNSPTCCVSGSGHLSTFSCDRLDQARPSNTKRNLFAI